MYVLTEIGIVVEPCICEVCLPPSHHPRYQRLRDIKEREATISDYKGYKGRENDI